MWEAIASNERRSWLLVGLMGALLVALGAVIGALVVPDGGLLPGAGIALAVWFIMWAIALGTGDSILLATAGAKQIEKEHAPQLWNVVEEMTIAAGLPRMPKIYLIDDEAPNAFAVGPRPDRAAVAVTSGLLRRLSRDELQGVIAHELGHIRNLDAKFMTMAGVMLGTIDLICDVFLRSMWYGGGRRSSRSSSRGGGQAQIILLLIAIALAILAPLLAQLLYFSCSRRREYLADASSARFTRYPEGLAAALEKISHSAGGGDKKVNRVVAPMYVVNPLQENAAFSLFSTHPPTEKRVKILRSMGGRAGLADYEAAFRQIQGRGARCIGDRTLKTDTGASVRAPSAPDDTRAQAIGRARAVGDLVAGLANFVFITCPCGVRLKVPPNFTRPSLTCPRCGLAHDIPTAAAVAAPLGDLPVPAASAASPGASQPAAPPLRYVRKGTGWESIKCTCGQTVQISPALSAPLVRCAKCNAPIEIVPPGGE